MQTSLAMRRDLPAPPFPASAPNSVQRAAEAIARSVAQATGADIVEIVLEHDTAEPLSLARMERPGLKAHAARPATGEARLWAGWNEGADRGWSVLRAPLQGGGGALTLRLRRLDAAGADQRPAWIEAGLEALAAAVSAERSGARHVASYQAALDRSDLPMLILTCDGALSFANRAGEAMLRSGEVLSRKGMGIAARDLSDAIRLQVVIEHVCSAEAGSGEDPVVALKRRHPLRPLLVCVSPLTVEQEGTGAILSVFDPDSDMTPFLEPVCAHYRLSPVEARLAIQLAKGVTIDGAAAALRIKAQTARSYLKQIFLKTDTNRQPDLVRVLLASTVRAAPAGRFRIV